jgi:hypothetical protein
MTDPLKPPLERIREAARIAFCPVTPRTREHKAGVITAVLAALLGKEEFAWHVTLYEDPERGEGFPWPYGLTPFLPRPGGTPQGRVDEAPDPDDRIAEAVDLGFAYAALQPLAYKERVIDLMLAAILGDAKQTWVDWYESVGEGGQVWPRGDDLPGILWTGPVEALPCSTSATCA